MRPLRIASISAEVDPFSKTGGLGDVARSLPKSLHRLGQDIIIITPFYKQVIDAEKFQLKKIYHNVALHIDKENDVSVSYYRGELMPGLPVYFISADRYFGRKKELYGSAWENSRFYVFDVAALKLLSLLKFSADIIHCHDWHTGLIPELLQKKFKRSKTLANSATVFTAHNLAFQLGHNWWEIAGKLRDNGRTALPAFHQTEKIERLNFAKRAILYADAINTVSETYAEEILKPNFGQDLHHILRNRQHKLYGVVNGIDYNLFNPAKDPLIKYNYSSTSIEKKKLNKKALQKEFSLPTIDVPLIVMASRIAEQKGFDILLPILPTIAVRDAQFVIIGDGDKNYRKTLEQLEKDFPASFRYRPFSQTENIETKLYAAGDIVLLPSHFEPCGTTQLKGLRYGSVPVVREIGGLGETVSNYDPETNPDGIGFVFKSYSSESLLFTLARALETYKHAKIWQELVIRGMRSSFSWDLPAKKYLRLYRLAMKFKREGKAND